MEDEWSEEDRIRFSLIFDQYPPGSAHYRQLLMDRLGRELSHKTRREIVSKANDGTSLGLTVL